MKNRIQAPGHAVLFITLIPTGWSFQNTSLFSSSPNPQHSTGNYYLYYWDKYKPCDLQEVSSWASGTALFRILTFLLFFYLIMGGWKDSPARRFDGKQNTLLLRHIWLIWYQITCKSRKAAFEFLYKYHRQKSNSSYRAVISISQMLIWISLRTESSKGMNLIN